VCTLREKRKKMNDNTPTYKYAKGAAARAPFLLAGGGGGIGSAGRVGSYTGSMPDLTSSSTDAALKTQSTNNNSNNNSSGLQLTPQQIKTLVEPITAAMQSTTYYDIMSISSLVVVLDVNSTVSVCVAAAQETRASSFLVWDPFDKTTGNGKFIAVLTLTNFIRILIHCHENQDQVSQLSNMSLRDLLFKKPELMQLKQFGNNNNNSNRPQQAAGVSNTILQANPEINLYDLLAVMVENKINHVPILADCTHVSKMDVAATTTTTQNNSSTTTSGAAQPTTLLGVAFLPQILSQVVRIINNPAVSITESGASMLSSSGGNSPKKNSSSKDLTNNNNPSPPPYSSLFEVPLYQLTGSHQRLANKLRAKDIGGSNSWLRPEETVYVALQRLVDTEVQALPIINEHGVIIDTFARSDVVGLEDLGVYNLNQSVAQALSRKRGQRAIPVCQVTDTVGDVVAHFVETGVRTIFVVSVENNEEFVGQIQVVDLLTFLYQHSL
jgi:CBS domain-containing protein/predicted transcriptional regulator